MKRRSVVLIIMGILFLFIVFLIFNKIKEESQIVNPASNYCLSRGYELEIREEENGQVGYCVSPFNDKCEEWAFYNGECHLYYEELCVPEQCCHATSCVISPEALDCSDVFCTMECRAGTMDCEAGYCDFVEGICQVVWNK